MVALKKIRMERERHGELLLRPGESTRPGSTSTAAAPNLPMSHVHDCCGLINPKLHCLSQ